MKVILTESQLNRLKTEQWRKKIRNWYNQTFTNNVKKESCSVDSIKSGDWKSLYSELVQKKLITQGEKVIIVWGPLQKLYITRDGKSVISSFPVSTGQNGFGNTVNDKKTPTGLMKVVGKIKGKQFEVLVSKKPTGTILGPNKDSNRIDNVTKVKHVAEVLTALLELDGLEECNENVFSRNIYFHGTNRESFLGTKRSNGCIRVSNSAILFLYNNIEVGTKVYVRP